MKKIKKMRKLRKFGLLGAAMSFGVALTAQQALASSPYTNFVDANEDMENDDDTELGGNNFTPVNNDPLNDPNLDGLPPGFSTADVGSIYGEASGADWRDTRIDRNGVIEEVASPFLGVSSGDGSANFAIVQFGPTGDGPTSRVNRDYYNGPVTGWDGSSGPPAGAPLGLYSAQADIYLPDHAYGGPDGIPDFWWTNAINSQVTNTYMTEGGFTGTVDPLGTTWTFTSTVGGRPGISLAEGSWYTFEAQPVEDTVDGGVNYLLNIYNIDHTTLLFTDEVSAAFTGPGDWANVSGPRYHWFTFGQANMPYLYVDNVAWASPIEIPEPASMILLGMGGLLTLARRRKA